ncbi:FliM/FliN family flagellar motor C-terminal domain-containing protein [Dyella sp. 2RAB6]|uniref:FliM/FliN family flagellar motor C-terminal domain-containing protein n=1 Tax=Dyella sp. 2RAB6 TaxID=3232992 RepID=UPI003F8E8AFE
MGETRRRAVAAKAGAIVQAWWDAWAMSSAQVAADGGIDVVPDGVCRQVEGRGVVFCIDGDLVGSLTGLAADQGGELAAHLERSALVDLARRMTGVDKLDRSSLRDIEEVPDTLADPRWGGCALVLGVGGLRLRLWLDRRAAAHWAPSPASRATPLVARIEAIAPASARLCASLDLGEIALDELQGLAPGDVIATLAPLSRPLDITVAGIDRPLYQGQLGERDGRRALRLASTEHLESTP